MLEQRLADDGVEVVGRKVELVDIALDDRGPRKRLQSVLGDRHLLGRDRDSDDGRPRGRDAECELASAGPGLERRRSR